MDLHSGCVGDVGEYCSSGEKSGDECCGDGGCGRRSSCLGAFGTFAGRLWELTTNKRTMLESLTFLEPLNNRETESPLEYQ